MQKKEIAKELTVIDVRTGEKLNLETAPIEEVSTALLLLDEQIKQRKPMFEAAKKWLAKNRVEEEKFGAWTVSTSYRNKLTPPNIEDLPAEIRDRYIDAKKFVEEMDKQFGKDVMTEIQTWVRPKY